MNRRVWLGAAVVVIALAPLAVRDITASWANQANGLGGDYRISTFNAGRDIIHSRNPYPAPDSDTLLSADAVYPPFIVVVAVPLALVPFVVSAAAWLVLLLAAAFATAWLVGVRDPRCFALWLVSAPVVDDLMWGNATQLVGFCAALAWYFRDHALKAAASLGAGAAIKLLLAPLGLWLVITRRFRAALLSAAFCVGFVFVSWAGIGFDGMLDYPGIIRSLSEAQTRGGLFLSGLLASHGWSANSAVAVGALPALGLLGLAWHRRRHDGAVFALTLVAILWLTPVNHVFNLILLMLAVAVVFPRLSLPWALMPLLWIVSFAGPVYQTHHDALTAISMTLTAFVVVAIFVGTRAVVEPVEDPSDDVQTVLGSPSEVSPA